MTIQIKRKYSGDIPQVIIVPYQKKREKFQISFVIIINNMKIKEAEAH